jgi:hypothetical protein
MKGHDLRRIPKYCLVTGLVVLSVPIPLRGQQTKSSVPWEPLSYFEGRWHGTSDGEPGHGEGQREYQFVLRGRFLELKNKTTYPPQQKNPKGETHEDIGFFSYDSQRKRFVLRQFHVEGFVNQYVEQERAPGAMRVVFVSERIENLPLGWRARETYTFVNRDEYDEVFELAAPQKEFAVYSQSHWKRVH